MIWKTSKAGALRNPNYSTASNLKIIIAFLAMLFILYGAFYKWPNFLLAASILVFGLFFIEVMKRKLTSATLIPIFLLWIMELSSGYFVNSMQWVDEAASFVPLTNRYFFLLILYFIFLAASLMLLSDQRVEKTLSENAPLNRRFLAGILLISFGGALYLLFTYLRLGFPMLDGRDRLEFSADSQLFVYIMRYRVTIFLLLGVYFSKTGSLLALVAAIFYIILAVLGADRITYPVVMISFFLVGYVMQRGSFHIPAPFLIISVISLVLIVFFFIDSRPGSNWDLKLASFARRISLQGQTWALATMSDYPLWDIQSDRVIKELKNLAFSSSEEQWQEPLLGAWYFMMSYLPKTDVLIWRINNDNAMIMILYPYVLEVYGLFPLITLNFLLPVIFALFSHQLFQSIRALDLISILLLGMILQGFTFAVITGDFGQIAGRWPVMFWLVYIFRRWLFVEKPVQKSELATD